MCRLTIRHFAFVLLVCIVPLCKGAKSPHPTCMTPRSATQATRDSAIFCKHAPNVSNVLMSTADVLKELVSFVHLNMFDGITHVHVHVHVWRYSITACVVLDQ